MPGAGGSIGFEVMGEGVPVRARGKALFAVDTRMKTGKWLTRMDSITPAQDVPLGQLSLVQLGMEL